MIRIALKILLLSIISIQFNCSNGSDVSGGSNQTDNAKVLISASYPSGDPAVGASVIIRPLNFNSKDSVIDQIDTLDTLGQFLYSDIQDGEYLVEIMDTSNKGFITRFKITDTTDTQYINIEKLINTGSLEGLIENDGNIGMVFILGTENSTPIDSNGFFEFQKLAEYNDYTLYFDFEDKNYLSRTVDSVTVQSDSLTNLPLTSNWAYSKKCFINTANLLNQFTDTIKNFPLLLTLDSSNINFSNLKNDGSDLRIYSSTNIPLYFEIETYNNIKQNAILWINIPIILPNNSDQYIVIKWGNNLAESLSSSQKVFNSQNNFIGVWHFNGNMNDATNLENNSTSTGSLQLDESGPIGKGLHIYSENSYLTIDNESNFDLSDELTISAWVKPDSLSKYTWNDAILSKGNDAYSLSRAIGKDVFSLTTRPEGDTTNVSADGFTQLNDLQLHFISGVKRGDSLFIYTDGVKEGSYYHPEKISTNDNNLLIGAKNTTENPIDVFHGIIDEVRISNTGRSDNWIKLCFENQKPNQKLLSFE